MDKHTPNMIQPCLVNLKIKLQPTLAELLTDLPEARTSKWVLI